MTRDADGHEVGQAINSVVARLRAAFGRPTLGMNGSTSRWSGWNALNFGGLVRRLRSG